jgi:ABC-2 type transport system ATP-binding protein
MNNFPVQVRGLKKYYGETTAVDDLSFSVGRGEIFGLLGPNGAGKTTTLECIEGLRTPDGGKIDVGGIDPSSHHGKLWNLIGVQLQTSGLPASMTPKEALVFFSRYHGKNPDFGVLERMGLSGKTDDQYGNLSTGQQRRLSISLAAAHGPEILFLDEPTAGLDVESRLELHSLMRKFREDGKTIILATHDMAEAEKLCDTIVIIIDGKAAITGSPAQITAAGDKRTKISVSTRLGTVAENRPALPEAQIMSVQNGYTYYHSENPGADLTVLLSFLTEKGDEIVDLRAERPSLEERFLEITQTGRSRK